MTQRFFAGLIPIVVVALFSPSAAFGQQETLRRFEAQFGRDYHDAERSTGLQDDVDLAKQMVEAAGTMDAGDPLSVMLLERAGEMGSRFMPGHETAFEAWKMLADRQPSRRSHWLGMAAAIGRKRYDQARPTERVELGNQLLELLLELAGGHRGRGEHGSAALMYAGAYEVAVQIVSDKADSIRSLQGECEVLDRVDKLKARLAKNGSDRKAADELMRVYVVELDDPQSALEYRFTADDRVMKDNVRLVTLSDDQLLDPDLLTLGDWYVSLEREAPSAAKAAMRGRAARYYRAYLERGAGGAAEQARVKAALATLGVDPAELTVRPAAAATVNTAERSTRAAVPQGGSRVASPTAAAGNPSATAATVASAADGIDLLALIDTATHGKRGEWTKAANGLRGDRPTPAQAVVPIVPMGDYELEVRFTRESVIGTIVVQTPVAGRPVLVRLGDRRRRERDYVAGLSMVSGVSAEENPTATPMELESGREYRLKVAVSGSDTNAASIRVELDGSMLFEWKGSAAALSVADAWKRLEPTAIGLGVDAGGSAVFHEAKLRVVKGEAKGLQ